MNCAIQTIVCHNCRELYDAFTRVRKRAPNFAESKRLKKLFPGHITIPPMLLIQQVNREYSAEPRPRTPPPAMVWEKVKPTCPVSTLHDIEPWKDPGRCPRCGNFMEKNGYPFRLWD